jgi:hypothetical protein
MEITIIIFYYLYLILLGIFLLFTFFNYYHLIRFGFGSWANLAVMIFFAVITVMIISISWEALRQIDWRTPLLKINQETWNSLLHFKLTTNNAPANTNLLTY